MRVTEGGVRQPLVEALGEALDDALGSPCVLRWAH